MSKRFLKPEQIYNQNLASGPLDFTTSTRGKGFKLNEVNIKFPIAVSETVTVTRSSVNGSNYNNELNTVTLVNGSSYTFRPQGECDFHANEEVRVQCTNNGGVGSAYVTVKQKEL